MDSNEIIKEINQIHSERLAADKKLRNLTADETIVIYGKLGTRCENLLQKKSILEKASNKINIELKAILLVLAKTLFSINKYEDSIKMDRRILKIDPNCLECYLRLFEGYCKIGKNDNGVIFGQMFKGLCKKNNLEYQYRDVLYKIDEETLITAKNFQNKSVWSDFKMTPSRWVKLIGFIISLIILVRGISNGEIKFFNKK